MTTELFGELVGEDLSGVTFVRDYLQLQFNPPPILNAYTPVTVLTTGTSATFGEETFANRLIAQIGKSVERVAYRAKRELEIGFEDGSLILISLRPDDYVGPEAINLFSRDGNLMVV